MKPSGKIANRGIHILVSIILICSLLCGRLVYLQFYAGDYYRSRAEIQQLGDTVIRAQRGTIYDRNMKVLAQSASVWLVYINPSKIKTDETRNLIATTLSEILNVSEDTIRTRLERTQSGYEKIKGQVEREEMEQVKTFIEEKGLIEVMGIDPDTKRYYPNSNFASSLLGFTGSDDIGRSGFEYQYNDNLTGTPGRIITALDGALEIMPNQYESTYDAVQGSSAVLTIDENIQYMLESALKQSMSDTKASYSYGIIMEVKTGAILAMVSLPDYNLNSPYFIDDKVLQVIMENAQEDKQEQTRLDYLYSTWRNRAVSDTYEPGSVFKIITTAAVLEEGLANENTGYTCTGSLDFAGHVYRCWRDGGHGSQSLSELLKNSCNPFAITMARLLGNESFYKYFSAFGFTQKTGVDLPSEAQSNAGETFHSYENFGISQLASYSFGQSFQVSPIQMITAVSAVANGGKLMTPYIVDRWLDADDNTIEKTEPVVKRQVISEKTAKRVNVMLEEVVANGTGKNAFVAGYHVAGKTGTTTKLNKPGEYVASFAGFAPANDPEIAILIAIDEPVGDHGGGSIAAPVAGEIFEKVLPYLNIEPTYTEAELNKLLTQAPNLIGKTAGEAKSQLAGQYTVDVVGNGTHVIAQSPEADRIMAKNGVIVLYTEQNYEQKTVAVPSFTGLTVKQASQLAINSGLNIKISGNSLSSSDIIAYKQSAEKDTELVKGSVITVYFKTTVGVED